MVEWFALDLSWELEKNEFDMEGNRCVGGLRDGNALCSLLNASCPADLDRFLAGANALPRILPDGLLV